MMHKPVQIKDIGLSYPHKPCFSNFSAKISFGSRIAIIGRNGAGKSSLLKFFQGLMLPTEGEIQLPKDLRVGYLPQIIDDFPLLSGGERLIQLLTTLLALEPNLLLLDEPSNHLDRRNRRSLIRMLKSYPGSLMIVSHDLEFIQATTNTLWHINNQKITVFSGSYPDYSQALAQKRAAIQQSLSQLTRQKKDIHLALMKEQERGESMRRGGEKKIEERKWPTVRSHRRLASAVTTQDKRMGKIRDKKQELLEELADLYQPEIIMPKFKLEALEAHKVFLRIQEASVAYSWQNPVLIDLNIQMRAAERIAFCGMNGSGKSTLVKAILAEPELITTGDWVIPDRCHIGYLDQHYQQLPMDKTVLDLMLDAMPKISYAEIRAHLNDFLFRKNTEVDVLIQDLSAGEKARLSLALIAAKPPKLLILDELTNNLDLETRAHVIEVLKIFPGAMIVISHDDDFLKQIQIETWYEMVQGRLLPHEGRKAYSNINA